MRTAGRGPILAQALAGFAQPDQNRSDQNRSDQNRTVAKVPTCVKPTRS